ncbi:MAG: hypothetical protein HZB67_05830 [Candidatus Aenigmarchaeota archaeon]|nr:hypothetical protein [Candidatus Aenigmarchaeota archaeon]
MKAKGITPVISIVLLLMITIALIGFAFVWFTKIWNIAATSSETQLGAQVSKGEKVISIDNINATHVTVRNNGISLIGADEVRVYINNAFAANCPAIPVSSVVDCAITCTTGAAVKVQGPTNVALETCP